MQEGATVSFEQANSVLGVSFEEYCVLQEEFLGQKPVWDLRWDFCHQGALLFLL